MSSSLTPRRGCAMPKPLGGRETGLVLMNEIIAPGARLRPSRPPKPLLRSVLREPRTGAISHPPGTAMYVRMPLLGALMSSLSPALAFEAQFEEMQFSPSITGATAPAKAKLASDLKRTLNAEAVISMPAAPGLFP